MGYPKSLLKIIKEAPLGWAVMAIEEWKLGKSAVKLLREWNNFKIKKQQS